MSQPSPIAVRELTRPFLAGLVGGRFEVLDDGGAPVQALVLDRVDEPRTEGDYAFWSAQLSGGGDDPLPQATYLLRTDAETFWLFLTPRSVVDGRATYTADFGQSKGETDAP